MFFRNLTFFRFPSSLQFDDLDASLAECALKPVGALELFSRGFVSPFGRDGDVLSHRIGDAIWLCVGSEDKLLPQVNQLLSFIQQQHEGRFGRGRDQRRAA